MMYFTTKARVRSGGKTLRFFILEDLTDRNKVYILEKSVCEWFDIITLDSILEVFARSDGIVLNVVKLITDPVEYHDERWDYGKGRKWL